MSHLEWPKGGVAIHTETDKDAETEKEINNIFPGSSSTKPLHSNRLYKSCHKKHIGSCPNTYAFSEKSRISLDW